MTSTSNGIGPCVASSLNCTAHEMPKFHDPSRAFSKLLTLHTTRRFYGNEDKLLTAKLLEELPGILN